MKDIGNQRTFDLRKLLHREWLKSKPRPVLVAPTVRFIDLQEVSL